MKEYKYLIKLGFLLALFILIHPDSSFSEFIFPIEWEAWERWGYDRDFVKVPEFQYVYAEKYGAPVYLNPNKSRYRRAYFMERFEVTDLHHRDKNDGKQDLFELKDKNEDTVFMLAKDILLFHLPETIKESPMTLRGFIGLSFLLKDWDYKDRPESVKWYDRPRISDSYGEHKILDVPYVYIYKRKSFENKKWYLVGKKSSVEGDGSEDVMLKTYGWILERDIIEWQTAEGFEPHSVHGKMPYYMFSEEKNLLSWVKNGHPRLMNDSGERTDSGKYGEIYFYQNPGEESWIGRPIFCDPLIKPPGYKREGPFERAFVGHRYWYEEKIPAEMAVEARNKFQKSVKRWRILFLVDSSMSMKSLKDGCAEVINNIKNLMAELSIKENLDIRVNAAVFRSNRDNSLYKAYKEFGPKFKKLENLEEIVRWLNKTPAISIKETPYTESLFDAIRKSIHLFGKFNIPRKLPDKGMPDIDVMKERISNIDNLNMNILFLIGDAGDHEEDIPVYLKEIMQRKNIYLHAIQLLHTCRYPDEEQRCKKDIDAQEKFGRQIGSLVSYLKDNSYDDRTANIITVGNHKETILVDKSTKRLIINTTESHLKELSQYLTEKTKILESDYQISEDDLEGLPKGYKNILTSTFGNRYWKKLVRVRTNPVIKGWIPVHSPDQKLKAARKVVFMTLEELGIALGEYRKLLKYRDRKSAKEAYHEALQLQMGRGELTFQNALLWKTGLILHDDDMLSKDINDILNDDKMFRKHYDYIKAAYKRLKQIEKISRRAGAFGEQDWFWIEANPEN